MACTLARASLFVLVSCLVSACGSSPPPGAEAPQAPGSAADAPVPPPVSSTSVATETKATEAAPAFPTACAEGTKDMCVPADSFATRICNVQSAEIAFALFAKSSPWTRGYLTRDADAWYASGGASARGKLIFDEEVIVVRKRSAGGIVVGQGGGYDVVRWDGSCASLQSEELTTKKPPKAKHPPIGWKNLESPTRDALLGDAKVSAMFEKRRKECKGATSGEVSLACVKADTALDDLIVDFVRGGGTVPTPKLPAK